MPVRDRGCLKDLLWRLQFDHTPRMDRLVSRLLAEGWRDLSLMSMVHHLEGPAGHTLVIVPRTNRIQIRVHYLTPKADRVAAAALLEQQVLGLSRDVAFEADE